MRVLVCGGRDYDDYETVIKCLDAVHQQYGVTLLIEGGANGADAHGGIWADNNGVPRCTMWAQWERYGKAAGPVRNQAMIDLLHPDCVVAFPGGKGTQNMIGIAQHAGVTVWRV